MKVLSIIVTMILFAASSFGQSIQSGEYDFGLKLAFDAQTKKLTGYFENYSGLDEVTGNPKFSCIFYIEGEVANTKLIILTYYPENKLTDTISGQLELVNDHAVKIKLLAEHGGCWNVEHFADEAVLFNIVKPAAWKQIKYVAVDKSHFYSEKSENKKLKAYLVKNNFVCIQKTEGDWVYCTYYGKVITKGWMKLADLKS